MFIAIACEGDAFGLGALHRQKELFIPGACGMKSEKTGGFSTLNTGAFADITYATFLKRKGFGALALR